MLGIYRGSPLSKDQSHLAKRGVTGVSVLGTFTPTAIDDLISACVVGPILTSLLIAQFQYQFGATHTTEEVVPVPLLVVRERKVVTALAGNRQERPPRGKKVMTALAVKGKPWKEDQQGRGRKNPVAPVPQALKGGR